MDDSVSDSCDPQNGGCERVSCVMERIPRPEGQSLGSRLRRQRRETHGDGGVGKVRGMGIGQSGQW